MVWICNGVEFKVGDKVRVVRQVESFDPNGMGNGVEWENTWCSADGDWKAMDGYLGLEFTIAEIESYGVTFETDLDGLSYALPLAALEKVSK